MLFHDGSQKTVTTKGLRRMSPQMREKHEEDLEVSNPKAKSYIQSFNFKGLLV